MKSQRIAFRTDATEEIGTGHFMRCLTLADEFQKHGAEICFIMRGVPNHLARMLQIRSIDVHSLLEEKNKECTDELHHSKWLHTSQHQDALQTVEILGESKLDWLIVDHYAIDYRWESILKGVTKKIMVIDDLADRRHDCDVLLDQNFYQDMYARYVGNVPEQCELLLGPSYAILRQEFRQMRQHVKPRTGEIKNILIYFGGIDSNDYTTLALRALIEVEWSIHVTVVVGQLHPKIQEIKDICKLHGFTCHVQTQQMAQLMAKSDLAVGAGGSSVWERFCMGLPAICIPAAYNQIKQLADLQREHLIFASIENEDVFEFIKQFLQRLKSNSKCHEVISEEIYQMVDGYGASRVCNSLLSHEIKMRLALEQDSKDIFTWRNHSNIRKKSSIENEIQWDEHDRWFNQKIRCCDSPILIGESNERAVGVVRFEINKEIAEVSIYLVPTSENHGLGQSLLRKAECWLQAEHPQVKEIHAQVLCTNGTSKRLFKYLNYTKMQSDAFKIKFIKNL